MYVCLPLQTFGKRVVIQGYKLVEFCSLPLLRPIYIKPSQVYTVSVAGQFQGFHFILFTVSSPHLGSQNSECPNLSQHITRKKKKFHQGDFLLLWTSRTCAYLSSISIQCCAMLFNCIKLQYGSCSNCICYVSF